MKTFDSELRNDRFALDIEQRRAQLSLLRSRLRSRRSLTRPLTAALAIAFAASSVACGGGSSGGSGGSGGSASSGGSAGSGGGFQTQCRSSGSKAQMVSVPAGAFLMGCNKAVDAECQPEENPGRQVTVSAFQIDKTEVTQDQYLACIEAGACENPSCDWDCSGGNLPASCINWNDARDFCAWAGKRLPTEAEWEKAARGTDGRKFPWGNQAPTCGLVNMAGCHGGASEVGSYTSGASPYGALDMAGDMVEMVNDWYDQNYYQSAPTVDPKGPAAPDVQKKFVGRGGGWKSEPRWQRTSQRDWYVPTDSGASLGFRCAK